MKSGFFTTLRMTGVFAALALLIAGTAWAIVAAPGDVVPLRLQITSAGAGVTGLKPKLTIIRQDGTVFRSATTMVPADGQSGVYGGSFTCPAGSAHYTAYENTTGMYADSETESIDVEAEPQVYVNSTSINSYLSSVHGAGQWGAGAITILPFQGAASYETVAQGNDVHVTYGDSASIPYSVNKDITGYTVWFGAKSNYISSQYAIPARDITAQVTDASTGAGLINLSTSDTSLRVGKYLAEVEIRNGTMINTVLRFNLWIDASVLN